MQGWKNEYESCEFTFWVKIFLKYEQIEGEFISNTFSLLIYNASAIFDFDSACVIYPENNSAKRKIAEALYSAGNRKCKSRNLKIKSGLWRKPQMKNKNKKIERAVQY